MAKSDIKDFNANDRIDVRLIESGVHYLAGEISEATITPVIKWIIYENLNQQTKNLTLYINSMGGDLYQAFALIDIMRSSKLPIRTIGLGSIMSAAFLIFASGTKGMRYIAPNTGIMCHQFSDAQEGKYHDIKAQIVESDNCNRRMLEVLKEATGLPVNSIKSKLLPASDVYLTADELVKLKVADGILNF